MCRVKYHEVYGYLMVKVLVTRRVFAIVSLVLTRFSGSDLCRTLFASICIREIVCTQSWNIEVLSKPSRMVIKDVGSMFFLVFF
jgi:hypothetical protein